MKPAKVRVLIATTEGPVAVQKITAEDPEVPSVACLDGTTTVLGISDDYARFVNKGTGLVADFTGHAAYRLDLDGRVDSGRSWQLPVLLAHLLAAEDKLAAPDESATLTILATGEVDRDQRVRPVSGMDEKIEQAGPLLAEQQTSEHRLLVVVPKGNTPLEGLPDNVGLLAWERFEGLAALGKDADERSAPAVPNKPPPRSRSEFKSLHRVWLTIAALAVLAIGCGVAWQAAVKDWEAMRRAGDYVALDAALERAWLPTSALYTALLKAQAPSAQSLTVSATELRTADGGSCTGRRFRDVGLVEVPLAAHRPGFYRTEDRQGLCAMRYRLANRGDSAVYAYLALTPEVADANANATARTLATTRAAALLPGGTMEIRLALPLRTVGASLLAIAAPNPSPQLRRTVAAVTSVNAEQEPELAIDRLPDLGVTLTTATHAVL